MTTLLNRSAADSLLSALDIHVRAASNAAAKADTKASADKADGEAGTVAEQPDGGAVTDAAEPLPGGEGNVSEEDIPTDPEELRQLILDEVKSQLDWDGTGGDPNASLAALEDALADMFDTHVDIAWNGEDALTMRVEGEEPVRLTAEYLGDLLEALAKQGAEGGGPAVDGPAEPDLNAVPDGAAGGRGYEVVWQRSGVLDVGKHLHAPKGVGGGRFVSKGGGGGIGGAVKNAVKNAADSAREVAGVKGGKGGGPSASKLATRAKGRAGPRVTAKAVSGSLSEGTGKRVKVSVDHLGRFKFKGEPKAIKSRRVAIVMANVWMANAGALAALSVVNPFLAPGAVVSAARSVALIKQLRETAPSNAKVG